MTLTLNANWLAAARRSNVDIVYLVTLTDGSSSWTAQSGPHGTMRHPAHLVSVSELSAQIDPITRQLQIGETELVLTDAFMRPIVSGSRLRGQKATVKVGFYDLSESDFVDYFVGPVEGVKPQGNVVTLTCLSALEILRQHKITGYWFQLHPLDIMYDILATKVGLHADLIDADSFDPDNYTDISHLVVGRYTTTAIGDGVVFQDTAIREPTPAFEILDELARLLHGTVYVTHSGKVSFRIFDASASAAATWSADDFTNIEVISIDDNVVNRVDVTLNPARGSAVPEWDDIYRQEDTTSQADLAYPGTSERIADHVIETTWLRSRLHCKQAGNTSFNSPPVTAAATSFILSSGFILMSTSGTQTANRKATGAAATAATVSADRPLYLLTDANEIIKVTSLSQRADATGLDMWILDPATGQRVSTGPLANHWDASGATRGVGGTVAAAFSRAMDVTVAYHLADKILKRCNYGLKRIRLKTLRMSEFDKEVGDLVRVSWSQFLAYGLDGVGSSDGTWEITRKSLAKDGIDWELAWAAESSYTVALDPAAVEFVDDSNFWGLVARLADESTFSKYVVAGLDVRHSSGLTVSVDAGVAAGGGARYESTAATSATVRASRDSYVFLNIATGGLSVIDVANGGDAPFVDGAELLIAKIVADASTVTSIDKSEVITSGTNATGTAVATWTERSNPKNVNLAEAAYGNGLYVAVGAADGSDAYVITSPDGVTWTERTNAKNFTLWSVTWSGSLFVAVGAADGSDAYIVTSPDGVTWTERANPKNFTLNHVTYGNGVYVAVGSGDGTDAYLVSSTNGTAWTERSNPKNFALHGVGYGNGTFVAVGGADGTDAYIVTSTDGTTWTERANPKNFDLLNVAYGNGVFVAVGRDDGTDSYIVTSEDDGVTWIERSHFDDVELGGIAFYGGMFVVTGDADGTDGYLLTSRDGVHWTQRVNPKNFDLIGVIGGGGMFVAVGSADGTDAYLLTSGRMA
jgi:hypothetical protein